MENEYYYVWVSLISGLDYNTLVRLTAPLKFDIKKFYELSSDRKSLYMYLLKNKLYISNKIYNLLVDKKIKKMTVNLYNFVKKNDILVVHIFSKMYKKIFKYNFNQSPVVFLYGNINLLKKKKYLVYSEKNSSEVLYIENVIKNNIVKKDSAILNYNVKDEILHNQIILCDLNEILNRKKVKENLYIYILDNLIYNLACICDEIILINAKYKKEMALVVDLLLEQGKEISILPNNILDKNAYFSNYLLSCGARLIYNLNNI